MSRAVLAIDQGTTSSRAILFDAGYRVLASAQQDFEQHFPRSGWVEHDPEDIWSSVVATARSALEKASLTARDVAALGITNQRETIVVWERATGRAICNAIVWQDRRTAETCSRLKAAGHEPEVIKRTGLPLDPYFSATKLAWILGAVPEAAQRAEAGELAAGTIDTFLLWKLTGGALHATDTTNASRTALFNIHNKDWDAWLLDLFSVPKSVLPDVRPCTSKFGMTLPETFGGSIPIRGIAGDQQAAAIGQACFKPGMLKSTYGTGCFALLNTGTTPVTSKNRLLTTIACQLAGETTYALEGSIYVAGAGVQWLRDRLAILPATSDADTMAAAAKDQDIILVPAFVGLGAPYWDPDCRGALFGLTRDTGREEIVKATLEAVCHQTADLIDAMQHDWPEIKNTVLRVDGGMSASNWTMQCLADILDCPVERPQNLETTALGAAYLAGVDVGFYPPPDEFARTWHCERRFEARIIPEARLNKRRLWKDAVERTLSA